MGILNIDEHVEEHRLLEIRYPEKAVMIGTATASVPASKTLSFDDAGKFLICDSGSAIVLTVPSDATAGWIDAVKITACRKGIGAVTFAAGAGVTLHGDLATPAQYGSKVIVRIGTNEWTDYPPAASSWDEVFVIGGQSNADGRGVIDASIAKSSPNVLMYDKGGNIRMATEPASVQATGWINNIPAGLTPSPPTHSFQVTLGKYAANLTGVRPILVPCAIGSTAMVNWLPPTVAKDMTSLFGAMNARADDMLAAERSPVFCWFGHEADELQTTETLATGAISIAYLSKWDQLVNNIRAIYPDSPIIYAQLAAINSDTLRDNKRLTGEVQRQAEDNGSAGVSTPVTLNPPVGVNTSATNTVTVVGNVVTMVGDGSTGVGFTRSGMVAGTYYRVRIKAEGTGVFRINGGGIKLDVLPAGDYSVVFQADGSPPSLGIYRAASGQPTNFVFTLGTVESITGYQIANTYMVVSHDLPRNASPDDVHISTEGQKELGRRYALAYAERVLGITTIDGTGPRLVSVTSTDATHTKVKFTQTLAAAKAGETNYSDGTDSLLRVYDAGTEKAVSDVSIDGADDTALIITHASCAGVRVVTYGDRAGQDAAWRKGVIYNTLDNPLPAPMFGPVVSV